MRQIEEELIGAALTYDEARRALDAQDARLDALTRGGRDGRESDSYAAYMARVDTIYPTVVERNRARERYGLTLAELHRAIDRYRELGAGGAA